MYFCIPLARTPCTTKDLVRTVQQMHFVSVIGINYIMLFREIIPVYSVNYTERIQKLCGHNAEFLGTFEKLRKTTISFVMSVHPLVSMKQLGSHWSDFHEISYLRIFQKSVQKIRVSLKSDKTNGYLR